MKKDTRVAGYIPEDVKTEIKELHEDGIKDKTIARYIGVSASTVMNILYPKKYRLIQKKTYLKYRLDRLKRNKLYLKEYYKRPYVKEKLALYKKEYTKKNRKRINAYQLKRYHANKLKK